MFELHVHSDFSKKDGLNRVEDIVRLSKEMGFTSVCITDHGAIGSSFLLYEECKAANLKPIFGCEFYMKLSEEKADFKERSHLIIIAKNKTGWNNLLKINRAAYDNFYHVPLITYEILDKYREGLLCSTACFAGPIARFLLPNKMDIGAARDNYKRLVNIFGKDDVYIELQPNSMPLQKHLNSMLYSFAKEVGSKITIGTDSHYLKKEHAESQETLFGINFKSTISMPVKPEVNAEIEDAETEIDTTTEEQEEEENSEQEQQEEKIEEAVAKPEEKKKKEKYRFVFSAKDFWFLSPDELKKMFLENHGNEQAYLDGMAGIQDIENKIEEFDIKPDHKDMLMKYPFDVNEPRFIEFCKEANIDPALETNEELSYQYLRMLTYKGYLDRKIYLKINEQEYIDRIKHELSEIKEAEIVDYFLIVWDILDFCRRAEIPTGTGRGCLSGNTKIFVWDRIMDRDIVPVSLIGCFCQNSFVSIANVKVGDTVVTETGKFRKVLKTFEYPVNERLIRFTLEGQHKIIRYGEFTFDHKIAIQYGQPMGDTPKFEWVEAKKVKVGDWVYAPCMSRSYFFQVKEIEIISGIKKVYDLEIEEEHSYLTDFGIVHNSAAGSLVAYLTGIHCVDSLKYGLLWERFYNAGRKGSMPDVDIDISQKKRHKVIEYLKQKYGENNTGHICNYTYFSPKNTFKYVTKFYDFEFKQVNEVVSKIKALDYDEKEAKDRDLSRDMALMDTLIKDFGVQKLLDTKPEYKEKIIRDCMVIIGGVANLSVHASGVVITAKPLVELCPTMVRDKNKDMDTSLWDMQMLDACGFLKIDLLGLEALDVIDDCLKLIEKRKNKKIEWKEEIPLSETDVMDLFKAGYTSGVFQFDYGKELQRLSSKFKPNNFADICSLTALARPGAKAFLDIFEQNKGKSEEHVIAPDPDALKILKETNYVVAYQEQQMALSRVLCGFPLKEADNLRKIIAKKKIDKIEEMRQKFVNGYIKTHMEKLGEEKSTELANAVWNEYFASCSYTFNKSHAVSYSLITNAMAWLKVNYPTEFMCAVLNHNNDGKRDELEPYILETIRMGIKFLPPSHNFLCDQFEVGENGEIYAGISSVKGLSTGDYDKIKEFGIEKAVGELLPKNKYEALVNCGFLDGFGFGNRMEKIQNIARYRIWADQKQEFEKNKEKAALKIEAYRKRMAEYNEYLVRNPEGKRKAPVYPKLKNDPGEFVPLVINDYLLSDKIKTETQLLGYSFSDPMFKYSSFLLATTIRKHAEKNIKKNNDDVCFFGEVVSITKKKNYKTTYEYEIKVSDTAKFKLRFDEMTVIALELESKLIKGSKWFCHAKIFEWECQETQQVYRLLNGYAVETLEQAYERWLKDTK